MQPQDLINQVQSILNSVLSVLQIIATFLIAFLVVLWLTLCFWAFRDIQGRTRDIVAQIFATMLVFFFNIPGVLLYILVRPKQTLAQTYEANLQEEYMLQDLEEREICHTCRVKTQPDFLFCYNCRTRLRRECPSCSQIIKLKWGNCPYCGTAQKPPSREKAVERAGLAAGTRNTPKRSTSTAIVPDTYPSNYPTTYANNQQTAPESYPAYRSPTTSNLRTPGVTPNYGADAGAADFEDEPNNQTIRDANLYQTYQSQPLANGYEPDEDGENNPAIAEDIERPTYSAEYGRYIPRHLRQNKDDNQ